MGGSEAAGAVVVRGHCGAPGESPRLWTRSACPADQVLFAGGNPHLWTPHPLHPFFWPRQSARPSSEERSAQKMPWQPVDTRMTSRFVFVTSLWIRVRWQVVNANARA